MLVRDREANSSSYSISYPSLEEKDLEDAQKEKLPQTQRKTAAKLFISTSTDRLIGEILDKYPVKQKSTRNSVLIQFAGELFHKFGWELSKTIIEEHYRRNSSNINTSLEEHMGEFDRLWQFIIKRTIETLSPYERAKYEKLHTPPQQEAFFIVRSFALLGKGQDFPVAQLSLADRLGVTQQGAGYVIEKLIGLGAIKKMADARINSKSATYHWTANHDSP
jgi:hypothetical protein